MDICRLRTCLYGGELPGKANKTYLMNRMYFQMYFLYFKCKAYTLYIHSISGGRVTRTKCYDNYSSRL
jgi:hypothetical protein